MSSTGARALLQIRPLQPADWPAVWALLEPVFRAGETFPNDPAITEAESRGLWVEQSQAVMVAVEPGGAVVGTYYLRPNSLCLGAHVANAGYVVAEHCRRRGIGSRLCQHSLQAARRLGFRAMQFNLVVSTVGDEEPLVDPGRGLGLRLLALVGALSFLMLGISSIAPLLQPPPPPELPDQRQAPVG